MSSYAGLVLELAETDSCDTVINNACTNRILHYATYFGQALSIEGRHRSKNMRHIRGKTRRKWAGWG